MRWTILVYLASRVLLLLVAVIAGALEHHSLIAELDYRGEGSSGKSS